MPKKSDGACQHASDSPKVQTSIEDALKLLDDLRDELDTALANDDTDASKALLKDIQTIADTLDEMVAERKE